MLVSVASFAAGALAAWLAFLLRSRRLHDAHREQLLVVARDASERVAAAQRALPPPQIIVDPAPERFRVIVYLERGAKARDLFNELGRRLASSDERVQLVDGIAVRGERRAFTWEREDDE